MAVSEVFQFVTLVIELIGLEGFHRLFSIFGTHHGNTQPLMMFTFLTYWCQLIITFFFNNRKCTESNEFV
ncbi:hypothetical protein DLAC_11751 [Tieghemostelium lacteum]|uniref:Transmembrane protein n=1 Tax=Tieghemostelium lacteum TaxID=361077 RepID=A0A151Z8K8_TIELA|nr:hypothetical protein DLAC_11751 [Tieghemostelium lacteum]|eukprot:KYQ90290.1 hypothetical protein DLAC_11751 [Tieghemostelium lacteum]